MPELVQIPAGDFEMGQQGREGPVRRVTIAQPFYLARTETTFQQYDAFCAATGCTRPRDKGWGRGQQPVINVEWNDASKYAAWLSAMTGTACRLPSEAEWEYAARAGTNTAYPWGDAPGQTRRTSKALEPRWSGKQTAPVARFDPNAWKIHDMNGNVWEWVQDRWHEDYVGAPVDGSAWEPEEDEREDVVRVARGGSWAQPADFARSAARSYGGGGHDKVAHKEIWTGFRVRCSSPIE